jgi:hypothetical protein
LQPARTSNPSHSSPQKEQKDWFNPDVPRVLAFSERHLRKYADALIFAADLNNYGRYTIEKERSQEQGEGHQRG